MFLKLPLSKAMTTLYIKIWLFINTFLIKWSHYILLAFPLIWFILFNLDSVAFSMDADGKPISKGKGTFWAGPCEDSKGNKMPAEMNQLVERQQNGSRVVTRWGTHGVDFGANSASQSVGINPTGFVGTKVASVAKASSSASTQAVNQALPSASACSIMQTDFMLSANAEIAGKTKKL
jgi:hypothetical protein